MRFFSFYRSPPFTWSSVSVVVSLSLPSRPSPPSTTARSPSAASATYVTTPSHPRALESPGTTPPKRAPSTYILTLTRLVSLPVPPTAVRRSAATPTSSAPRRSSNKRLAPRCCARCAVVQTPVQGNGWAATWRGLQMALDMMKQSMQPQSYCS